jgi:hypothetical protein
MHPRGRGLWVGTGVLAGLLLHGVAGWGSLVALAQGSVTFTSSFTTSSSFESPPACTVGSSRTVETATVQQTLGPLCIGIGNRDVVNPSPACAGVPAAAAPSDPFHGTVFLNLAGTTNFNDNTNTETIQCVAAVPALPWPALLGLGGILSGLGVWRVRRPARPDDITRSPQPP